MNVNTIINNSILKPLSKTTNSEVLPRIMQEAQEIQSDTQKIYAQNLSSLGCKVSKNFSMQDKARLDELANNYITKFFSFLSSIESKEKRTQYLLNAINKPNHKFVQALSIDMRTFYKKVEDLQNLVGLQNYGEKIYPAFKDNYKKYLDKLCNDTNVSLEYLLSLRPDWSFMLVKNKMDFTKPYVLGEIPKNLISESDSNILFKYLAKRAETPPVVNEIVPDLNINNTCYKIHRFGDGCNKGGAFLVENNGKKYVVKVSNVATIDNEICDNPYLKAFPSRDIFTDYYLAKNNCINSAKLYCYKFDPINKKNFSIYEYVDGETRNIDKTGVYLPDMVNLKLFFTDTRNRSNVIFRDNIPVCVDTDNSIQQFPVPLYSPTHHKPIGNYSSLG